MLGEDEVRWEKSCVVWEGREATWSKITRGCTNRASETKIDRICSKRHVVNI